MSGEAERVGQTGSPKADWLAAAIIACLLRSDDAAVDAEAAYERMLKTAFFRCGSDTQIDVSELARVVERTLGVAFPEALVLEANQRLVAKREMLLVKANGGERLALAADCYSDMEKRERQMRDLREAAIGGWVEAAVRADPRLAGCAGALRNVVEDYIIGVASFVAVESRLSCEGGRDSAIPEVPRPSQNLLNQFPAELHDSIAVECTKFFLEADKTRLNYMDALLDGYFELQLLHCAPEMQNFFVPQLRETTCFLDTNVVLDVLGISEEASAKDLSFRAVEMAKSVGVTLCVSEETRQEYLRLLDEAKLQRASAYAARSSGSGRNPGKASPFLVHYVRLMSRERSLTWREYEARYRDLAALLQARGIRYESGMFVRNRDSVRTAASVFDDAWPSKRPNAREHDAAMYLLVRQLRVNCGSGVKVWFLTRDYTLYRFDAVVRRTLPDAGLHMPSFAMRPHAWIQWLRSRAPAVLKGADPSRQFGRFLYDLSFARPERDARVVGQLTVYLETYRDLDPELIQSQDTARVIEQELELLGGEDAATDQEVVEVVDRAILAEAERARSEGKLKDEELTKIRGRVRDLERQGGKSKKRIGRLEGAVSEQGTAHTQLASQVEWLTLCLALSATAVVFLIWVTTPSPWRWLILVPLLGVTVAARIAHGSRLGNLLRTGVWTPVLLLALFLGAVSLVRPLLPWRLGVFVDNNVPEIAGFAVATLAELRQSRKRGAR